jgi:hypothetical protein
VLIGAPVRRRCADHHKKALLMNRESWADVELELDHSFGIATVMDVTPNRFQISKTNYVKAVTSAGGWCMRAVKAILTLVVDLLLVSIVAAVIIINYGAYASTSTYECFGLVTKPGTAKSEETKLFIKIRHYGWWLWTDSDGLLHYEIPNTTTRGLFFKLQKVEDYINIYHDGLKLLQGQFSTVSNVLFVNTTDEEIFTGSCKPN